MWRKRKKTPDGSGSLTPVEDDNEFIDDNETEKKDPGTSTDGSVMPGKMNMLSHPAEAGLLNLPDRFEDSPLNQRSEPVTPSRRDAQLWEFLSTDRSARRNAITDVLGCHAEAGMVELPNRFEDLSVNIVSGPAAPPTNTFNPQTDSLHASMRPIIMLAQCFSMFPVCGVNTPDASYLRFTWRSPKIIYCAISLFGLTLLTIFNIMRIISTGVNSTKMTTFVFNGTNLIASFLFLKLGMQWPSLMLTWEKLEKEFSNRHRKVSRTSLSTKFKIVTIIVMIFALVEHSFSILHGSFLAQECAIFQGDTDIVGVYFQSQFPQVFSRISYSLWKGILVDLINVLSTFSWNFVDLFLILISIALVEQFRQLNDRLYSIKGKAMPEWWWAEARSDYNHLASLTRQLDSHISIMVLLSFATDLYFICIQLLFSFNPMRGIVEKIYFGFSFGFLLARTTLVSLYAASIHDESLLPAPILYSVSGNSFSTEVMRFLTQVTTDSICLTGMKFFSVTRGLVLTVVGTIVTYELVLVQFNNAQQNDSANTTTVCEVK